MNFKIDYYNTNKNSQEFEITSNLTKSYLKKIDNSIKEKLPFYKVFNGKEIQDNFNLCKRYIDYIHNNFENIIVVGMGGAILNPKMLSEFNTSIKKVKSFFISSTDTIKIKNILDQVNLKDTAIIAISNSGETLETISIVGGIINEYQKLTISTKKRFFFITKNKPCTLYNIGQKIKAIIIPHMEKISGRFSTLSNTSLFSAAIEGFDVEEYLNGAVSSINNITKNNKSLVDDVSFILSNNKSTIINMGYLSNFISFLDWYCQIIAESLGKNHRAPTPLRNIGPEDQHSMMQLYLEGPRDKIFNLFYIENDNILPNYKIADIDSFASIKDKELSQINRINFDATIKALVDKELPVRSVMLKDFSPFTIGSLTSFLMLEVILVGNIMQVNPFDQPAVELIKNNARDLIV